MVGQIWGVLQLHDFGTAGTLRVSSIMILNENGTLGVLTWGVPYYVTIRGFSEGLNLG